MFKSPRWNCLFLSFVAIGCAQKKDQDGSKNSALSHTSSPSQQTETKAAPAPAQASADASTTFEIHQLSPAQQSAVFDSPIKDISGKDTKLADFRGKVLLVVNVASQCGLTPQYEPLQSIHKRYSKQGFSVIAFPCNQFGGQEPGSHQDILSFAQKQYNVTFPLMEKIETNGDASHPIYKSLTQIPDESGESGDVGWNFEKFLLSSDGTKVARIRSATPPDDPKVLELIRSWL